MFINLTNHPISIWSDKQLEAARLFGEIVEIPFPAVDPNVTAEGITALVDEYLSKVLELHPDAILVAGEFAFAFQMTDALLRNGINVVTACSMRETEETVKPDGTYAKVAKFNFVQFRPYQHYPGKHPCED